jgi:hypothetical protein
VDEQNFHHTLRKIRWSIDCDDLERATEATLRMMLRRPNDQQLLDALLDQLNRIIASATKGNELAQPAAVRQAAVRCVALLQSAKQGRLSRSEADRQRRKRRWRQAIAAAGTLLLALAVTAALASQPL